MLNSDTLLSANLNAFICSSVRSPAIIQGTSLSPNCLAALSRVCPAIISLLVSIMIGTLKPNSLIELATYSTASSLKRGLFLYSHKFFSFTYSILIQNATPF